LEDLGKNGRPFKISDEAMAALVDYSWPGNIRELKNVVERAGIVCRHRYIRPSDLPLNMQEQKNQSLFPARVPGIRDFSDLKTLMEETEKKAIQDALELSEGKRAMAAEVLGIHRTGLYQKMKKYKLI
jgi:DNA-binding NtrC family response regulator